MTSSTLAPTMQATDQIRFSNAMKTIRRAGIVTRINLMSCCRGCAQLPSGDLLWTFGGQGGAHSWVDGKMVSRDARNRLAKRGYGSINPRDFVKEEFFFFEGIEAAKVAQAAFTAEGFTVDWDGTEQQALVLNLI